MKIGDCMKRRVISAKPDLTISEAAKLMVHHHIGSLPITNDDSQLIGLVRIRDLVKLAMPDFIGILDNVDFLHDFGVLEKNKLDPEILRKPVSEVMIEPICVELTAGLLKAISLLQEHKLNDLPVVDGNMCLVGIASQVDIGVTFLSNWDSSGS